MSSHVEIMDVTSTSELPSNSKHGRKCIADGDDQTALKSLGKIIHHNSKCILARLDRSAIYLKRGDYKNAREDLYEIFNIDSQNQPALSQLYKITKIQAKKFTDAKLFGAAAGCYMKLLRMSSFKKIRKLKRIFLTLLVRHELSIYTELSITGINNTQLGQNDRGHLEDCELGEDCKHCKDYDLVQSGLRNVIGQRRSLRNFSDEATTASSGSGKEEDWITRSRIEKGSKDCRSRKISPRERKHSKEEQTAKRKSKHRRRVSFSMERSYRRGKRSRDDIGEEEQTAKRKSKHHRRVSCSMERNAAPGPSGIIRHESKKKWKVVHRPKSKRMRKDLCSRKRCYKRCHYYHHEHCRDFCNCNRCKRHCYESSSLSLSSSSYY